MEHDEEWLKSNVNNYRADSRYATDFTHHNMRSFAKDYAERMNNGSKEFDAEIYESHEDAKVKYEERIAVLEEALGELHTINHCNKVDAGRRHGLKVEKCSPHPLLAGKEG